MRAPGGSPALCLKQGSGSPLRSSCSGARTATCTLGLFGGSARAGSSIASSGTCISALRARA
eukprot:6733393-Lingulodinium_polyedra.AAC.1